MAKKSSFKIIAKTFSGLEDVLKEEIVALGGANVEIITRGVSFDCDLETLYRANFYSRTALRFLWKLAEFDIMNQQDLYDKVKESIDWHKLFLPAKSIMVSSNIHNSNVFNNGMFVSQKAKDAIVDRFREEKLKRPYVDTDNPSVIINVHIAKEKCTVLLDSSGKSLHLRGYKVANSMAPINEVLAAGMIKMSGWDMKSDFFDPMCGSGTFSIEAALMAKGIPPGVFRDKFAFENWTNFDPDLFMDISEEYEEKDMECKIYASDFSPQAIKIASANMKSAFVFNDVKLENIDFAEYRAVDSKGAVVMLNPPYGERLKVGALNAIYELIGRTIKHKFVGARVFIISSNKDAAKHIGLKPTKKTTLFNGPLECIFNQYDIFGGKHKDFKRKQTKKV
ncbi:MAG: class I SAM-dependent RNA methyltransferase [Bacteroidales bacterium]